MFKNWLELNEENQRSGLFKCYENGKRLKIVAKLCNQFNTVFILILINLVNQSSF